MAGRPLLVRWVMVSALVAAPLLVMAPPALRAQNQQQSDQAIVDDINAKLFADSTLKEQDVRVSCQDGVVTLRGSVATELEKSAVDRIASTEMGVQKVIDSLSLGSGSAPAAASATPEAQAGITVPAGTVVTIRMIDSVDSKKNQPGQEFDATIDAPVASGSRVVIPQGSNAKVRLATAQDSGRIQGSAELELELVAITVNGTRYPVQSGYYQEHGASRGKRTATAAGGGAVLGALIGAIAGGGKGAAIGAGSGAAIGTGASVAMKGSSIKVPPETRIDFTLREPVILNTPSGP